MKLAVFGANGPTGRLLTPLALDEDHDVVAFTRHHPQQGVSASSLLAGPPPGRRKRQSGPSGERALRIRQSGSDGRGAGGASSIMVV
jgi:nucleoside-diphosphate-sugar epimerase